MKQEFVTLPREVVEQALDAFVKLQADDAIGLASWDFAEAGDACFALRAALEQPQNHVPETGNMAPAGWKLVPVEPTREMLRSAFPACGPVTANAVYRAMLDAAPQPPTTEQSSVVEQPQGEQEPVAWIRGSGFEMLKLENGGCATVYASDGMSSHSHPLYTRQQPKQPPTDEQIDAIAEAMPGGLEGFMKGWGWRQFARAVLEATHNIK